MGKKKKPDPENEFLEEVDQWLDSDEGEESLAAVEAVQDALDGATIDVNRRRIVWPDGKALTIEKTARKIQTEYEMDDLDAVISHVVGWLEMSEPPSDLDEEKLEKFEDRIEDWIDDFKSEKSE